MENSFAVITGASSGIGFELARQFGAHGYDLLIVSNSNEIFSAQDDLENQGYSVDALKANLATYSGVENLYEQIRASGRPVDAIAINAGVGGGGEFTETDLREEINLINLNIVSVVHLTKRILSDMKSRGQGRILFNSSITSQMPSPFEAVYEGSKSFINSFAESLRKELKDSRISITVLMPGATDTNFIHRARIDDSNDGHEMKNYYDPAKVAEQGFEALMNGKERVFSESLLTKLQGYALKLFPVKAKAQLHRKMTGPGTGSPHH
jgi:uncharacterized protein